MKLMLVLGLGMNVLTVLVYPAGIIGTAIGAFIGLVFSYHFVLVAQNYADNNGASGGDGFTTK